MAFLLALMGITGCASAPPTAGLARHWRDAEIAVTNLTPHSWRIALRTALGADVKTVEVKPREAIAMVMPGGDYVVEQVLLALDPAEATKRNFSARFEAGQHYHWSLATLLSAEEPVAP
jgi:hypothetical protein